MEQVINNKPPITKSHAAEPYIRFFNRYVSFVRLIVVIVVLLIGALALYNFYIQTVVAARDAVSQRQTSLAQKQVTLDKYKKIAVDYASVATEAQAILDVLPNEEDLPSIYAQLGGLVSKQGLTLRSINVSAAPTTGEVDARAIHEITVTAVIDGGSGYASVKSLLADIEQSLRLFDVTAINFDPRQTSFTLVMKTYYKIDG